ncbi:MAG: MotA/TolQ/ExbB proton channel family protein [Phycisphaerales bacterium]
MSTRFRPVAAAIAAALTALLTTSALAQTAEQVAAGAKTVSSMSRNAQDELNKSIADLNALRAQIAAEKLPLAQQLTTLEESVIALRKDGDRIQRLVDAGALEIGTLQAEIKTRQDELGYITNLLDEYARNFETKVGVGEMQVYGAPVEKTKSAVEDKNLSQAQKFATQVDFTSLTAKRLGDVLGGTRFDGVGVDMMGTLLKGKYALIGPVSLFRSETGVAGVAVQQPGSPNPVVRPLEGDMTKAVDVLLVSGEGTLPLDPSRGGALKALIQKTNLWHIFVKGGPIMWPLLVASIIAIAVVIERVLFLLNEQRLRSPRTLAKFFTDVEQGNLDSAIAVASKSRDAVVSTLGYALQHRDQSLGHALTYAETRTLKRYKRGIAILDTVITLAPLLGLLGTVTGMMASFSVIGGDLSSPGAITGGIAEALIATAFGLMIAITSLIPFNYLNNRIEQVETEMLAAGEQLKLLVEGRAEQRPARAAPPPPPAPEPALAGGL